MYCTTSNTQASRDMWREHTNSTDLAIPENTNSSHPPHSRQSYKQPVLVAPTPIAGYPNRLDLSLMDVYSPTTYPTQSMLSHSVARSIPSHEGINATFTQDVYTSPARSSPLSTFKQTSLGRRNAFQGSPLNPYSPAWCSLPGSPSACLSLAPTPVPSRSRSQNSVASSVDSSSLNFAVLEEFLRMNAAGPIQPTFYCWDSPNPDPTIACTATQPRLILKGESPAPPSQKTEGTTLTVVKDQKLKRKPKKHRCEICQRDFPRPSGLITHMYSHNGLRPFPCSYPGCTKAFSVRSNAKRHLRTHRSPSSATDDKGNLLVNTPIQVPYTRDSMDTKDYVKLGGSAVLYTSSSAVSDVDKDTKNGVKRETPPADTRWRSETLANALGESLTWPTSAERAA